MEDVDRISDLTDPMIHQILSSFDMKEVVQTSVLSKRWKNIWKSAPFLNFGLVAFDFYSEITTKMRNDFVDFVDRTLFLRDASSIHKFSLDCCEDLDASCVYKWVIAAIGRNVDELYLESYLNRSFELPRHLFTSSIRKITLCTKGSHEFQLPNSICKAKKLEYLELSCVKLPDKTSKEELIISCPLLKHLQLHYCEYSKLKWLTIACPLLETLHLKNSSTAYMIKICCPNLKSLFCKGELYEDYAFENLEALETVEFEPSMPRVMTRENSRQCMMNFFAGIQNVSFLKLYIRSSELQSVLSDQWEGFPSLKQLEMCGVPLCMAGNILERSPYIESLRWDRTYVHQDWRRSYSSVQIELCLLKIVEIYDARQDEDELEFLKIILEKAVILDEVIIVILRSSKSKEFQRKVNKFSEKISKIPRAASGVHITGRIRPFSNVNCC